MKTATFAFLLLMTSVGFSQNNPINFEAGGFGDTWTWTVFENDTNPPLEIIANPDPSGGNTSATVAKFTALQAGQPFAGCETMHGTDIGTFNLTSENAIVKIWVWKAVISDVGIKFATPPGGSFGETKVANTLVDQWEELTFDFTPFIDHPKATNIDQLIIFPDFDARSTDNIIYFDNITFGDGTLGVTEFNANSISSYPNPVDGNWNVKAEEALVQITLYNMLGEVVKTVAPNLTTYNMNVSELPSGIYFATVATASGEKSIKLIKN